MTHKDGYKNEIIKCKLGRQLAYAGIWFLTTPPLSLSPTLVITNLSMAFCNLMDVRFRLQRCCNRIKPHNVRLTATPKAYKTLGDPRPIRRL